MPAFGHSTIRTTADLYQHAETKLDAEAALRLERAIGGAPR